MQKACFFAKLKFENPQNTQGSCILSKIKFIIFNFKMQACLAKLILKIHQASNPFVHCEIFSIFLSADTHLLYADN